MCVGGGGGGKKDSSNITLSFSFCFLFFSPPLVLFIRSGHRDQYPDYSATVMPYLCVSTPPAVRPYSLIKKRTRNP